MARTAADASHATEIDQLVEHIQSGEKLPDERALGLEHEKFGFHPDFRPISYHSGVVPIFDQLQKTPVWEPEVDEGNIIALTGTRGCGSITLEPGAQLELSGGIVQRVDEAAHELASHLDQILSCSSAPGIRWLAMGTRPLAHLDDIEWVPKSRYNIMRNYLPSRGSLAHYMMKMTCTVQVNVDFTDESDCGDILKTVLRVTPITSALFASSPFLHGKPSGHITSRCHFWTDTDPDRTGYLEGMLAGDYGYRDYVEYALDVPMFFIKREGHYLDATTVTFRQFMSDGFQGHTATLDDWEAHLSTIFPEVRLKRYIEVRGMDCGPPSMMIAAAALWKGLVYDQNARKQASELTSALDFSQRLHLHHAMIDRGLQAQLPDGTRLLELAEALIEIAGQGLERLRTQLPAGDNESALLDPLRAVVQRGQSLSAQMLNVWHTNPTREGLLAAIEPMWVTAESVDAIRPASAPQRSCA